MGRRRSGGKPISKSYTLPSSPSHSSSDSSDFEFTISLSPRKSSTALCPADELFYKGQLLPLHLSPRISMVRTLLLSSSTSSSSTATARDSTDSHSSFNSSDLALYADDSSRPSSVTEDDEFKRLHNPPPTHHHHHPPNQTIPTTKTAANKYFSLSRFSSVFRNNNGSSSNVKTRESVKRMSATAKEVIRKYLKKVKPLYEKFSQSQKQRAAVELSEEEGIGMTMSMSATRNDGTVLSLLTTRSNNDKETASGKRASGGGGTKENMGFLSHSFSGNLRYPRSRRSCVSSCPSSMRSSPSHSGVLSFPRSGGRDTSSMEELQSAIQGAIAHCKNSLTQTQNHNNKRTTMVSNEI
ncbi:hypothetical protein RIF29_37666 [Crotalaria pallida]|uniref:Membrane-associated kinase regulator 1 n=1 Tax=Crotalaria pallida TaxID=3830 RepID=A0AAN9EDI0_CROPI